MSILGRILLTFHRRGGNVDLLLLSGFLPYDKLDIQSVPVQVNLFVSTLSRGLKNAPVLKDLTGIQLSLINEPQYFDKRQRLAMADKRTRL